jgi:hypothetical protein
MLITDSHWQGGMLRASWNPCASKESGETAMNDQRRDRRNQLYLPRVTLPMIVGSFFGQSSVFLDCFDTAWNIPLAMVVSASMERKLGHAPLPFETIATIIEWVREIHQASNIISFYSDVVVQHDMCNFALVSMAWKVRFPGLFTSRVLCSRASTDH